MKKRLILGIILISLFLVVGCSKSKLVEEKTDYNLIMDYNILNYTVLNISRKEFEAFPYYRQVDWLNGVCYPSDCEFRNPPVCSSYYLTYCYNPNNPINEYFRNQKIK